MTLTLQSGKKYTRVFHGQVKDDKDLEKFLQEIRFEMAQGKHFERPIFVEIWTQKGGDIST